ARLGILSVPGYSQRVGHTGANNRELVTLTFRSLEAAFARGGEQEATSAVQEAFGRRISSCLIDLPSPEELKELPEDLQREVKKRQQQAALLRQKREAAVHVIPAYHQLLENYRAYDAEAGSPRRIARYLMMSATTVLVGGVLGYLVEREIGVPYATVAGIGLGIIAFFRMIFQTLGTTRHMTRVESAHAAELQRLQEELYAAFEAVDRQRPLQAEEDPTL
ncbi:MAG: hypothetical protein ACE5MG_12415, partial [Candidatus Methylomirabilales bacterium]